MRKYFLPILLVGIGFLVFAAERSGVFRHKFRAEVRVIYHKLGSVNIPIKVQQYGERKNLVFINLHDDEITSVEATRKILEKEGGLLIELENNENRNIRFRMSSETYTVDPNCIFSEQGITRSLKSLGRSSSLATKEVKKFSTQLLDLVPDEATCIIALHNNTDGLFSANSYSAGNERSRDAKKVYTNKDQDPDDFFFTTDVKLYEMMSSLNFNTILQNNSLPKDDGSLSVYCGKRKIRYVNLETEHGKSEVYYKMMKALIAVVHPDADSR